MELNEGLERLSLTLYRGEDAIAYLRGLADATPAELEADEAECDLPEADLPEADLRTWRGKVIRHHEHLRSLGYKAVVSGAKGEGLAHGLYRKALGDRWTTDAGEASYMDHTDIRLPVVVIFEGNLP